ncbi:MAG: HAMP domain-containing sensor histidine kinase, partial [Gillisia sp.]
YSNSLATKVHSSNFSPNYPATYSVPLFVSSSGKSKYQLLVNFTGKKKLVLSSVTLMAILSIIFTLIIVVAYSSALTQLIKQRQISQIKTDFINNMTHEFKTPIATINLALDAIKNPKIINDQEKVSRYLQMIRDENKRMHAQVENVLQISKLERNELDLKKERVHLHEIIEDAITHVSLIVEDRNGYIKNHFGALKSSLLGNRDHLTNVVVNILDNAIKYSEEEPKIDIYTENVRNYIVMKVRDQGVGMSRGVQKKIFQKFYREHTGDIHNVKGHGLGLAYSQRILEDHHGTITVVSEKGKGSTFIIKLPLIT